MVEICCFKEASTLSFVSMATLFCPQIKYPLWCFFQRTKGFFIYLFFYFLRFVLLKAWQFSQGPVGTVLAWPVHNWPQTNVIWAHWLPTVCHSLKEDQFVPTTVKILCFSLLPTYRWGLTIFFDLALMYTGRQDSIS